MIKKLLQFGVWVATAIAGAFMLGKWLRGDLIFIYFLIAFVAVFQIPNITNWLLFRSDDHRAGIRLLMFDHIPPGVKWRELWTMSGAVLGVMLAVSMGWLF